jgi:hypothetical protein
MNDIDDGMIGDSYLIPSGAQVLLGDGVPVGPEPEPEPEPKPVMPAAKGVM